MTTRRKFSLRYKILVIFSLTMGIVLNVINTTSITSILSYYTLQSNIICLIAFVCFLFLELRNNNYKTEVYYLIKGAIIIAIFITALVYSLALLPMQFEMDFLQKNVSYKTIANFLVHILSPVLVIADYFLFDEKGNFKCYYPALWIIIPLNYVFYVYLYSSHGGRFYNIGGSKRFAYIFLDYEKIGYAGVAKCIVVMAFFIIAVSYLLVFIDSKLKKRKRQI